MITLPKSRQSDIVVQKINEEILIYDLKINKAFCLNETSALIYQLCDGNRAAAEIGQRLSEKFNTKVSEDLVWLALEGLKKADLLENGNELTNHFAGLARREVIKRVGLASMIALPFVSSLTAPTTVNAQSCINFGQACSPTAGSGCCPMSICVTGTCGCRCINPGQCLSQTACPNTNNCNPSGVCAP